MTHADILRTVAAHAAPGGIPPHPNAESLLAGADALDTLGRVRAVLADLRDQQEATWQAWDDTGDPWDGATSDALHDTIHLLTEALEGVLP